MTGIANIDLFIVCQASGFTTTCAADTSIIPILQMKLRNLTKVMQEVV